MFDRRSLLLDRHVSAALGAALSARVAAADPKQATSR